MVGIAVSNPSNGMAVRPLRLLCVAYVSASETSRSLIQRSPTVCVCVCACLCVRVCTMCVCVCVYLILCHLEMSRVRRSGPKLGCCVTKVNYTVNF